MINASIICYCSNYLKCQLLLLLQTDQNCTGMGLQNVNFLENCYGQEHSFIARMLWLHFGVIIITFCCCYTWNPMCYWRQYLTGLLLILILIRQISSLRILKNSSIFTNFSIWSSSVSTSCLTSTFRQAQSVPHVLPKNKINRIHKIIYFCQSYIRAVKSTGKAAGQKSAH